MRKAIFLLCFYASPLFFVNMLFANECKNWQSQFSSQTNLVFGDILINTTDVFDPSIKTESTLFHLLANQLHIKTRPSVIRQQILFATGEPFNEKILQESERLIQANRFIKEARIIPLRLCGNRVTIEISTKDMWTLTPGVSFGRSGGKNRSGVELQEHNLFGLGKSLAIAYKQGTLRDSTLLSYSDSQLWGSRKQFKLKYEDNSDGKAHLLDLNLPFYALDSRRSWGIKTTQIEQQASLYRHGKVVKKIADSKQSHALFYGWSKGHHNNHVLRFKVGWQLTKNEYDLGHPEVTSLSESYPWFETAFQQDKYTQRVNFKTMDLQENISLGLNASLKLGLLHPSLGSDVKQIKMTGELKKGFELGKRNLGFLSLSTDAYYGKGLRQGAKLKLNADWYAFNSQGNQWYVSGRYTQQTNLLPDEQVLLGGATGLRGYPEGFQNGDKSVLFRAERRTHFNWYPLRLAKFGAVAFVDSGSAWGLGSKAKLLTDVGLGLRIVPTRSSSAKAIHIDVAFPLDQQKVAGNYQVSIETRQSF